MKKQGQASGKTLGDEGAPIQIINQFRDLGGHVCMDLSKSAVTLNQRMERLERASREHESCLTEVHTVAPRLSEAEDIPLTNLFVSPKPPGSNELIVYRPVISRDRLGDAAMPHDPQDTIHELQGRPAAVLGKTMADNLRPPPPTATVSCSDQPSLDDASLRAASSFKRPEARTHKLEASIWDCMLLVGLQGQGVACIAWAIMLLLLNIAIQSALTYIVLFELAKPEYDDDSAKSYRTWRTNSAHALKKVDLVSQVSLAARVREQTCVQR